MRDRKKYSDSSDRNCTDRKVNIETIVNVYKGDESYHHRHETCSVNAPPARGPATDATALTAPIDAKNIGLCRSGTIYAITVNAPEKIPCN